MKIPTLETERLVLRAFKAEDLEAYAPMCADPEVMRYLGDGRLLTRMETWRSMAMLLGHWDLRGHGMWAVTLRGDDRLIGRAGFFEPEGWPGFEIGWTFARVAWGHGYATEAAARALAYARQVMDRREVISVIVPGNERSIRVAERIGEKFIRNDDIAGKPVLIYGMKLAR
jgi:RimJ/RimL family protein N-acetyltransferase